MSLFPLVMNFHALSYLIFHYSIKENRVGPCHVLVHVHVLTMCGPSKCLHTEIDVRDCHERKVTWGELEPC